MYLIIYCVPGLPRRRPPLHQAARGLDLLLRRAQVGAGGGAREERRVPGRDPGLQGADPRLGGAAAEAGRGRAPAHAR